MGLKLNIFLNKKILIYGLGKSGLSAFQFLKNKNDVLVIVCVVIWVVLR